MSNITPAESSTTEDIASLGGRHNIRYAREEESLRETKEFLRDTHFILGNQELSSISPVVASQVASLVFPQKPQQWALFQAPTGSTLNSIFSHSEIIPSLGTAEEVQSKADIIEGLPDSEGKETVSHLLAAILGKNHDAQTIDNSRRRYARG